MLSTMNGSLGANSQRLLDQLACLWQAQIAIRQRVAQGVVGAVVVRVAGNELAQQAFHLVGAVKLFCHHG